MIAQDLQYTEDLCNIREIQIKEQIKGLDSESMYNVNVNECDKQIVKCFKKQIQNNDPSLSLLKSAPTDLYAEIEERKPIQILQILRISWI